MEGKLKKSKGPNTHSVWWCYIVAILLILIYLLPIYIMLNLSFRTLQDLGTKLSLPAAWNFGNYVEVFKSGDLWLGFKNSIILVVETVTLEIVLSALAAYGLARSSGRLAESIRNINMGIMMIPSVALLVGTYGLMVKFHMTNTLYGLALLSAAGGIPGTMFMYVNFVVSIPTALDEAAAIDGAGVLRTFTQIIMPQLKPVTASVVIITGVNCWNNYQFALYLLQSPKIKTITLAIAGFFSADSANVNGAAAAAFLGILPVIVVFLFLQKYFIQGMVDSAIK